VQDRKGGIRGRDLLTSHGRLLAGQLFVFRPRTDLARVLVILAPLIGAALIAISRLEDYRHDVFDVSVGSVLGLLVAYSTYRRYYPPLSSPQCETPYSPSGEDDSGTKGFIRIRDEEEGASEYRTRRRDSENVPLQDRAGRSPP